MKLNLGCGESKREGYINLDYPEINLEKIPYPFDDNSVDEVLLSHVLEHLWIKPTLVIEEIHRILKPDGILILKLPIRTNIVQHVRNKHSIYYMNYFLTNPVGSIAVKVEDKKRIFYCKYCKKTINLMTIFNEKRLGGEQGKILKIDKSVKKIIFHMPHRVFDLFFNGEIVWKLKKE